MATLLYTYVTNRIGRFTISLGRKAHDLNMKLVKCQLGTTCTIEESPYTAARPDITRFAVITSIYNTGDLAASKLKGNWNLSCSQSEYDFSLPTLD
jgi:hypothetical protein